ncbi:hypothetical protein K2F54_05575 [Cryobacterium sp. 1639]|uniref:hypothetical protein n=1 Tax=Cryobacterium inferilacus TaxID=2866629 RepID=UPI001C735075|nr:hypothetical protein [Cryobacterium sp. 1639]MBX0299443.1 hypothetical protein [Cryobacterium sp. 1639]
MRRTLLAGALLAAAAVVVAAGAFAIQQSGSRPAETSDSAGTPSPVSPGSPTPIPSPGTTDSSQAETGEADTGDRGEGIPSGAPAPAPEETPPGGTPPEGPPPEGTLPALVSLPLPDTATAVGSIVAGFPAGVIPEPPDSVVEVSSVATEGSQLQAALSGRTTLTADEVLDFYRTALAELGLSDAPAPSVDGSSAIAFTRGNNSVALTVSPIEGGCRYVVFGTFTAGS